MNMVTIIHYKKRRGDFALTHALKERLIARIEKMQGIRIVEHAEELGIGTPNYEIINID